MYKDKSSFLSVNKTTAIPPIPTNTLTGMDIEEMRDYISRREMEFAVLEQSVSDFAVQCDERISSIIRERDAAVAKTSQLEILLKGRQSALISKEEEIQRLKSAQARPGRQSICSIISSVVIVAPPDLTQSSCPPQMSITCTVPHLSVFPNSEPSTHRPHLTMVFSDAVRIDPHIPLEIVPAVSVFNHSPPRTVYHHKGYSNRYKQPSPPRPLFMSTESIHRSLPSDDDSSDGFSRPLRRVSRLRLSTASMHSTRSVGDLKYRESFSSVRSAVSFVHSSDDDSDASLDDLVTSTMRLSRISTSSRKSPPKPLLHPPAFPKRWFK